MTLDEMTNALNAAKGGRFGTDYAGFFDISDTEAERIAAKADSAAAFETIWENETWWKDEANQ